MILNLDTATEQICNLCKKPYITKHRQSRYCGQKREDLDYKCVPLTATQRRHGITDEVRRGEAVAIPDKKYGKTKRAKPSTPRSNTHNFGQGLSRLWLSRRL